MCDRTPDLPIKGRVHSIESFGTVDGPGTRLVIFLQGCPLRCAYCHNPDSWDVGRGTLMTAEEILALYEKNRPFYRGGGITVSGGEPLLQPEFLALLFSMAKKRDISTCIDTSGICFSPDNPVRMEKLNRVLEVTDLILLDIKHIDPTHHKELTGHTNVNILAFAAYLEEKGVPFWVRHVVVPGLTDQDKDLYELGYYLGQFRYLKVLEVLPYHTLGVPKYQQLDIPYPLAGVPEMDKEILEIKKKVILMGLLERRRRESTS